MEGTMSLCWKETGNVNMETQYAIFKELGIVETQELKVNIHDLTFLLNNLILFRFIDHEMWKKYVRIS